MVPRGDRGHGQERRSRGFRRWALSITAHNQYATTTSQLMHVGGADTVRMTLIQETGIGADNMRG